MVQSSDFGKSSISLAASNAKVERVFSQVNIIKTNKRTLLSSDALGDLLLLSPIKYHCKTSVQMPQLTSGGEVNLAGLTKGPGDHTDNAPHVLAAVLTLRRMICQWILRMTPLTQSLIVYMTGMGGCLIPFQTEDFVVCFALCNLIELFYLFWFLLLPARASEQGNVIGLVSVYIYIYIYMSSKKIVIEHTRDLILPQICSDRLLPENN